MTDEPKVLKQITLEQEKILKILEAMRYGSIENIKVKDGKIRILEVRLTLNFDDPESFKKSIEELRTIPLL